MSITTSQANFHQHLDEYLDAVNDDHQTVCVTRSHQESVAVIAQEALNALLVAVNAAEDSLDYSIARDQLIEFNLVPDDPIVEPNDDFWDSFKPGNQR